MAATTLTDGPVLRRFRKALDTMYGHRLDRVCCSARAREAMRVRIPITMWPCSCATWPTGSRKWIGLPTRAPTFATRLASSFTPCPIARFLPTPLMLGIRSDGIAIADYEIGVGSEVSLERAAEAIAAGKRFVAQMIALTG
jgi:hypothetical protein